jgi:hypothetical protein
VARHRHVTPRTRRPLLCAVVTRGIRYLGTDGVGGVSLGPGWADSLDTICISD